METEDRPVEIKDLNKTQLILLAILLSFVTSIATGIVTVTLMQQAPTGVTQTINRVVQQTIEKVVPDYIPGQTQTVVVKEDDLVVDAVTKTRANFATVLAAKDATEPIADAYSIGNGVFLVTNATIALSTPYVVKDGDAFFDVKVTGISPFGFSILTATTIDATAKKLPAASFGKDTDIKTGQTLVLVSGKMIHKGLVQGVQKTTNDAGDSWNVVALDPEPAVSSIGSLAVNLDGSIVGLVVPKGESGASIIGADAVTKFIAKPLSPMPAPAPGTPVAPTPTN